MLHDPQRTPYDLNFQLFGFPVRIHPMFWVIALIMGSGGFGSGAGADPKQLFIWVVVVFVSILVHELGHAFAFRYFGSDASVVLYALGGLAMPNYGFTPSSSLSYGYRNNSTREQIIISAAGPAAGFGLAAFVVAILYAANRSHPFMQFTFGHGPPIEDQLLWLLVSYLLFVNIFWGLINLLPVYPLDGGQISREVFLAVSKHDGLQQSLMLSVATGAAVALYALLNTHLFLALMFGYLAFNSYQTMQGPTGRFGGGSPW